MKRSLVSWYCLLLLTLATRSCGDQTDDYPVLPEYDLCNPKVPVTDPPRIYMEKPGITTEIFVKWEIEQNDTTVRQCHMLFKSCASCRIRVETVAEDFWNQPCVYDTDSIDIPDCIPGCIYMYLLDNFYKNMSLRAAASYNVIGYQSQSSQLNVVACAVGPLRKQNITMKLRLTVIDKLQEINGDPYNAVPRRTFTSPNFPNPYISNSEVYSFKFQSASQTDFITVSFDDWVVSPTSEFSIEGANLIKVTGQNRRPYIISNGQSMRMFFDTGEFRTSGSYFTYLGFRAVATFYKDRSDIPDVQTDCGQMITDSGGIITLSKIADGRIRDCIWVIKKTPEFDGVYLKLLRYRVGQGLWSYENKLEIKDGLTSTTDLLLGANPNVNGGNEGFEVRSDVGFYIRLKGSYLMEDALVISYAMFMSDCTNSIDYFKCGNGRCIPAFLKCDTYDHCGDKSDESATLCNRASESSRGSDYSISIGVIIPMVVSVFLVIVMCLLIIFIRRCRRLNNSTFGNRPNGVTQAQGRGRRRRRLNHNVQMSVTVSSGEHPPSYEEVIQNTPIGYLNMAFSWSQSDTTPTAPPSYEEAIMPPSTTPSQNVEPAVAHGGSINNLMVQGAATLSSPQHQISRATFMASLDPGAYVSSSSSSEYASETENRMDLSSSSDTSTDEHSSFITNRSSQDLSLRTSLDPNKNSDRFSVAQNAGKSVSSSTCKPGSVVGDMQVELDDISLSKHKAPANVGGPTERSRLDNDLRKNERNVRENGHRRRRDRTISKEVGSIKNPKRKDKAPERPDNVTKGSRDALNASENGSDGLYVKRNHKKPIRNGTEGPSHYSENASKITESSRSQSCFDLSLGGAVGGAVPSYSTGEARYEDKRFSYAGYGDVSLKREDLDPFCAGRGLVRDRPIENLNKYTAQSCDNLLQGYNIHADRDHHMVHENPQQSSSSCLDVSIKNRKAKQPHHTSSASLSKFSDTGRSLHPVPEIGDPRPHAEPNRHIGFDKNSKPESHSAQVITDLKPLQSVLKSTHDYKSPAATSQPVKHGQTSKGNIPNSKTADMLTLTPGPYLVLSDDAHRSTPDQEHQRVLSPNSDRTSHNSKDVRWPNSSEHKNSSDKPGLPLLRDQHSFENPHRADAQLRDRQPRSPEPVYDIATPIDDKFRSHPKSVSPSDRRTYQKEIPEPIYQRPNHSRENGRVNSGNSVPRGVNVRHNQGPEPIYKIPKNQSRDQPRSNQENDLTMGENVGHKQRPESIYQVPRQNQDPPRENPSSAQLRQSQSVGNVRQKPTPAPRQAKKSTFHAEREQAPIPRMRSHSGTERQVGHPDNSSPSVHLAQQSHHNQRPGRATGNRFGNSVRDHVEETELRGRSDQVILTLDPNVFQANENDVFV